jgi:hypothetical protein
MRQGFSHEFVVRAGWGGERAAARTTTALGVAWPTQWQETSGVPSDVIVAVQGATHGLGIDGDALRPGRSTAMGWLVQVSESIASSCGSSSMTRQPPVPITG